MRKLVKILLSLLLVAPAAALALGVGEVQLHSALNQRLNAEIKLLSVDPAEAESINVSLASGEDFAKVGLERPASLMFLRFAIEKSPSDQYYIKLTSKEPIREPFLDFLLEVKWRSGRVLREYTLLLDPPVRTSEAAPAITAPTTASAPAGAPAAPEEEFVPPPSSIPVAPGVTAPASFPGKTSAMAEAPAGAIVYGPVKDHETLWGIARKLRPSADISVQQMMMALLIANPYAFFDNNINRLKKGFILRIDDPSVLKAMSKSEAAREVFRQTRQWQDYRAAAAARAEKRAAGSAPEAPTAAVAAAKKEPKLELVSPEGKAEKPGATGTSTESLQQDLMLALESSAAQRKENEDLQKRVQGLEGQLQDMQRLLNLKDADLAALQKQLHEQGQALTLPSGMAAPPQQAKAEAPQATVVPAAPEKAPAEKPAAKPPVKKPVVKRPPPPPPVQEPSIVDTLLGDPLMLAAVGGAAVLILLLLVLMIRRRRGGGFQESILSGGTSSMLAEKSEEASGETSFLSDLAVSGMGGGSIHADEGEVDPITEAEVFIAYGRHQQAEEVLKKALEKNPDRQDLIAKLLEVYYNLRNADGFVAMAEENAEGLKANESVWGRIASMGSELVPDNPLFEVAEGAQASGFEAPAVKPEPISEDVLDIGLDLDELTAEMESEGAGTDLDLGLDFGTLEEEAAPPAKAEKTGVVAEEEVEAPFEFDLNLGAEEEAPAEEGHPEFEFDLGGGSTEEAVPEEAEGLGLDLGELEGEATVPAAAGEEEISLDFDLGESAEKEETGLELGELEDLDFGELGLESTTAEAKAEPAATEEFGLDMSGLESLGDLGEFEEEGLLSDSEEITTKLDLAQAYIEMGDNEGARSMLEEVAEAGNDEQKQQAEELLAKI